jgi:hypothetical protein
MRPFSAAVVLVFCGFALLAPCSGVDWRLRGKPRTMQNTAETVRCDAADAQDPACASPSFDNVR